MISRRDLFGMTTTLISAGWLRAQSDQRVVVGVSVSTDRGLSIRGLKLSDFRVFEDGILQKISTFAAGGNPARVVNEDGALGPLMNPNASGGVREDLENSYILTYYPDPSNHNEGYRIIKVDIVPDVDKRWRVRHRPGYPKLAQAREAIRPGGDGSEKGELSTILLL